MINRTIGVSQYAGSCAPTGSYCRSQRQELVDPLCIMAHQLHSMCRIYLDQNSCKFLSRYMAEALCLYAKVVHTNWD